MRSRTPTKCSTVFSAFALVAFAAALALVVGCNKSKPSPTDPTGPNLPHAATGLYVHDEAGRIIANATCTLDTLVDSKAGLSPDVEGFTPPVDLAYPEKFFDQRPWRVQVRVQALSPCGTGTPNPCFATFDDFKSVDWAENPRYGKYLRADVQVVRSVSGVVAERAFNRLAEWGGGAQ